MTTGEYIGCVEADDYIENNMFEKLYMYTNNGTVDIVKSNFGIVMRTRMAQSKK